MDPTPDCHAACPELEFWPSLKPLSPHQRGIASLRNNDSKKRPCKRSSAETQRLSAAVELMEQWAVSQVRSCPNISMLRGPWESRELRHPHGPGQTLAMTTALTTSRNSSQLDVTWWFGRRQRMCWWFRATLAVFLGLTSNTARFTGFRICVSVRLE